MPAPKQVPPESGSVGSLTNGDRAAEIIQNALSIEIRRRSELLLPEDLAADREQRARIIRCSPASSTARHIVVDANGLSTSRGGSNNIANIEIVCRRCNEEKGSLTREEFLRLRK